MAKRVSLREVYWYNVNRFVENYDCLRQGLLIAKLEAYGLDNGSFNLLLDYLTFSKKRTKVGPAYSNDHGHGH